MARLRWSSPRESSRCSRCGAGIKADQLIHAGRPEEATRLLIDEDTCSRQPHSMLAALMLTYVRLGRLEKAVDAFRQSYSAFWSKPENLDAIARHVEFCARTGNSEAARKLVERHAWRRYVPSAERDFHAAAALAFGPGSEHGSAAPAVAARFDARNGNSARSERIRAFMTGEPVVDALDLGDSLSPRARELSPASGRALPDRPEPVSRR
ncbi:hypothetical protein [Amycolatopsis regifaucium]|uniref:Tetratricopeptide repeat protein n=1 Tax=Amycolatopsis regifaucium TaxID=546365 RepID=A0A154MN89_9PSEU|nr:hypothetical protein [Amycolatopsis regifaucium]KZB85735.1 hypothetical protein AVL48_30250 [Amycolatopsis regifaucium]OKA10511.1 hypothetical protein ATP06_0203655 [Amycolatopsis regifaucium]SFI80145.1 hypothetical protein SAMN04489731_113102 [Amycolatopsis regifaucium]